MSTRNRIIRGLILTQLFLIATSISEQSNNTTVVVQSTSSSNATKDNSTTSVKLTAPNVSNTVGITIEGGGKVNLTEQPTVNVTKTNQTIDEKEKNNTVLSSTQRTIPIYEDKPPVTSSKAVEHKKIAARKGVVYNETKATTVKPIPKKPTVTIPGQEEPFAPSHFQSNSKSNESSQNLSKVPLDIVNDNSQESTQKYVVPIVVVILSVPFVAIIISILYKRGAEWWRYRHYRRMDFLINGMYDG